MLKLFKMFVISTLLVFVGVVSFMTATPTYAADVCPQGKVRNGYIAYKICLWKTDKLVWGESESRGSVRRELYEFGTLNRGVFSIEVGLHGLKPNKNITLFYTDKYGAVKNKVVRSNRKGNAIIVISTLNGQGTLWVLGNALTGEHFVSLRSVESVRLEYNQPNNKYFTRAGEDVFPSGRPRYPATRLNTSVFH